jgi:pimeloyl-ACP methyl ester carboxylesterase
MIGNFYQPSISYWSNTGQQIRVPALSELISAITSTHVVLMIHGYNNTQQQASDSYTNFLAHLSYKRKVNSTLIGIYWPGANWEGPLYYMQALGQAKRTAPVLASGLMQLAQAKGYLEIDIVTHSLGGRLALETIKNILLLRQTSPSPIIIGKITMMAGAVPVTYLADVNELQASVQAFEATQSLYSLKDTVLEFAFPAGETAAGEGFLPIALGRKQWSGGSQFLPLMNQQENIGARHGDYWSKESAAKGTETFAADQVYNFLNIGPNPSRTIPSRSVPGAFVSTARTTLPARQV